MPNRIQEAKLRDEEKELIESEGRKKILKEVFEKDITERSYRLYKVKLFAVRDKVSLLNNN